MTGQIDDLIAIMARLRHPDTGCPWDIEQDFLSIAPYTLEEAFEVVDAIERGDLQELKGELGDLLLQVIFHARMAEELGLFAFDDVVRGICEKMLRRHPHVFGDDSRQTDADTLHAAWEEAKALERAARQSSREAPLSALDDVAVALPALVRAQKIQKRAARVGFDWTEISQVKDKLQEELIELEQACKPRDDDAIEDEIGDVLFSAVNLARHVNADAETALRRATAKFDKRFRHVERLSVERGLKLDTLDIEALELLWQEAKRSS